jgi:xanthine dehydrogenase accessory factor
MTSTLKPLKDFLAANDRVALVEVAGTKGSTPRETGAFMLVSPAAIHGTIGGGQLEYMAIDKARQLLRTWAASDRIDVHEVCATLDIPLGPEIGQCCGGRVEVAIRPVDEGTAAGLIAAAERQEERLPHLYIFGGGHVGKALAAAVALLPVHAAVVETRAEELEGMPDDVETLLTPVPEAVVREAPAGSAFAVLTHDHALDFLIVAEALKRSDTAYVGMIGSKTKKATFKSWFQKTAGGTEKEFARLVSPIGGDAVKDKRPAVIAALAAAEMMTALALCGAKAGSAAVGSAR